MRRVSKESARLIALVVSAGLTLAACGASPPNPPNPPATASGAGANGSGPVTIHSGGGDGTGQQGQRSTGTAFSLAFARCMRAHGMPSFPDPGGQLGPGGGADPASQAFQAALNGPCRPLAPPAWVSSGQVSGK